MLKKRSRKLISLSVMLFIATIISSCSFFDPKYDEPNIEVPELWKNQNKNEDQTVDWDLPKLAWWRNFEDADLNSIVVIALRDNEDLQMTIGNILQADSEINKANYAWLPTASIGGGGFMALPFDVNASGVLSGVASQPIGGSLVGVIPSYTINIAREYKMGQITRLGKKANISVKNATRLSIISRVCIAYISLLSAERQLDFQSEYVSLLESIYKDTDDKMKSGIASSLESEEFEQIIQIERSKVANINNDIIHFKNALRNLMGKNPGDVSASSDFDDLSIDIKTPVNMPSQVLKNRPDIAIAEYKLEISNANIGLARSQFFPNIDLTGAFGNATLALGELATVNAWEWLYFASAAMPIFNMSILADSDKAKSQFYEAYYNYIGTLHQAFQDVENALSEKNASSISLKDSQLSLQSAKRQQQIIAEQYKAGIISEMSYKSKTLNTVYVEMLTNQAKLKYLTSIIALYQSLGSGYEVDDYLDPHYDNPAFSK